MEIKPNVIFKNIKHNTNYLRANDSFGFYLINKPIFKEPAKLLALTDELYFRVNEILSGAEVLSKTDFKEYEKFIAQYAKELFNFIKAYKPILNYKNTHVDFKNIITYISANDEYFKLNNSLVSMLLSFANYKNPTKLLNVQNKIKFCCEQTFDFADSYINSNKEGYAEFVSRYSNLLERLSTYLKTVNENIAQNAKNA